MSYAIWIKVEDEMGQPGDKSEAWWAGEAGFSTRKEAVEAAEEIASKLGFERIDDKWSDEDDDDEALAVGD